MNDRTDGALFIRTASGHINDANERACRLLRLPADALRGVAFHTFVDAAHRSALSILDERLRAGRDDEYQTVVPFGAPDAPGGAARRPRLLRASGLLNGSVVVVVEAASTASGGDVAPLSPVEATVLELTAQGLTTAQIAKRLHYSDSNVSYHLASLGSRFGTNNRTALVSRAYALGFLSARAWPPRAATHGSARASRLAGRS